MRIAPSLLAADFMRLGELVRAAIGGGADLLHVDVMDGHFVPNLSMGPVVVKALKGRVDAELDVHLMVTDPASFIEPFARAGADWISFHIEATPHAHRLCQLVRDLGCRVGVAINPATPIGHLQGVIDDVDFVLMMSVNPGFGGQSFIPSTLQRLDQLNDLISRSRNRPLIQVDGGIGAGNIRELGKRGVDVAVAGSSVFGDKDPAMAVRQLLAASRDEDAS